MYRIVPRTEIGLPAIVTNSDGVTRRPPLSNERYITAHYTGVDVQYALRDVAAEVRRIQMVFGKTKPFEYNYVIGATEDDRIYEFAGKYAAAHSAGENGDAFGVLFLLGVGEYVSDKMIDKWRWLRDVLIADGSLSPNVDQRQHFQMPGAATACAGASIRTRWPEFLKPWQSQAAPPVAPIVPKPQPPVAVTPPPIVEDEVMLIYAFTNIANTWSDKGIHLSPEAFAAHKAAGATVVLSKPHAQHLHSLMAVSGIETDQIVFL